MKACRSPLAILKCSDGGHELVMNGAAALSQILTVDCSQSVTVVTVKLWTLAC